MAGGADSSLQPHTDGDTDGDIEDNVLDDLPAANKFGFEWHSAESYYIQKFNPPPLCLSSSATTVSSAEDNPTAVAGSSTDLSNATSNTHTETSPSTSMPNRHPLSRAFSMPLPSQLNHLRNPCRRPYFVSLPEPTPELSEDVSQFQELSFELADSVQMVIQTLLPISPPQVLDPAKEQFSACSISFPASAMSAVFISMKILNYISASMSAFCSTTLKARSPGKHQLELPFRYEPNDFDIGELLQNVGDALSGAAAEAGVDVILYHGDVALKHVIVRGDESGITCALSHIVRQIIRVACCGDSISLGLFVTPIAPKGEAISSDVVLEANGQTFLEEQIGQFQCTFHISHKCVTPGAMSGDSIPPTRSPPAIRSKLLQRLLSHLGASLMSDESSGGHSAEYVRELTFKLDRGSQSVISPPVLPSPHATPGPTASDIRIADEPSLEELTRFAETLRGKKATLFASTNGSFAHHLTSYLTAWGLDVSPASGEAGVDENAVQVEPAEVGSAGMELPVASRSLVTSAIGSDTTVAPGVMPSATTEDTPQPLKPVSFILIDDDVAELRERLRVFHAEQTSLSTTNLRKNASPTIHWARASGPAIRSVGQAPQQQSSVVIIHFTSLTNYKMIKDVVQSDLSSYAGTLAVIPEVMIILKPAGPRRVLTALHTAVIRPTMDPYFSPIATSPSTPNLHWKPSFSDFHNISSRSPTNRPAGSRANSERSARSTAGENPMPIPSPLGLSDAKEYFPELSTKLGASPSSGMVIQSPDGQRAGIFFHPKSRASWVPTTSLSSLPMEREKGQPQLHSERRISATHVPLQIDTRISQTSVNNAMLSPTTQPALEIQELPATRELPSPARKQQERRSISEGRSPPRILQSPSSPTAFRKSSTSEIVARKAVSPPTSPRRDGAITGIQRKFISKRSSSERYPSSHSGTGKHGMDAGDANIVPPISVLIVDDNPINQTILSTFMKKKRIKYDVANNGQEAVEKWRTGDFHLILMDIQMPVMDGIQATKEIRRLEKENAMAGYPSVASQRDRDQTPTTSGALESWSLVSPYRSSVIIVALTALSLQSDRVAVLAAGCNDFLTKPVSLLWLNNKIIEWGSIKALQMWADVRSDTMKSIPEGPTRNVVERLHMPQGRTTPSPSRAVGTASAVPLIASKSAGSASPPIRSSTAQVSAGARNQSSSPSRDKEPGSPSSSDIPMVPAEVAGYKPAPAQE